MTYQQKLEQILKDYEKRVSRIIDKFDIKGGRLTVTQADILLRAKEIKEALIKAGYYKLSSEFIKDNYKYISARKKELEETRKINIGKIDTTTIRDLEKTHLTGFEDLGERNINAIKSAILQGALVGTKKTKLVEMIRKEIDKLQRYSETYYNTAKTQYRQTAEDLLAEEIGFGQRKNEMWEYVGAPLQKNSHPECIWALSQRRDPYFTTKEKEDFEAGVGAFPHPIPRWNCQHYFFMVWKEKPVIDLYKNKENAFYKHIEKHNIKLWGKPINDDNTMMMIGNALEQMNKKYGMTYDKIRFYKGAKQGIIAKNRMLMNSKGKVEIKELSINANSDIDHIRKANKMRYIVPKNHGEAVIHEYGHLLSISKYMENPELKKKLEILFREYLQEIKEHPEQLISLYSKKDFDEFLAEAFADYNISATPKKYSKKVVEILEGEK